MTLAERGRPGEGGTTKRRKRRRRDPEAHMSLRGHLEELRNRLTIAAVGIVAGSVAGFFLYDWIFELLSDPIQGYTDDDGARLTQIAFNAVGQPFDLLIRISLFVGVIISSPLWLYQLWAFIMPGLRKVEKRYAMAFIGASVPLFVAGILMAYIVLPRAIEFFFSLNPEGTANIIAPDIYFTFVLHLFLACGIAMIVPVILVGINMMGIVSGKQILHSWRWVVLLIAVISAMAAPGGEAITMFFIMGPMTLLFGVAIGLCLLHDKRAANREARQAAL